SKTPAMHGRSASARWPAICPNCCAWTLRAPTCRRFPAPCARTSPGASRAASTPGKMMPAPDPRQFYDDLAADYHLLFADWGQAIRWQGDAIDRLIRAHWPASDPPRTLLDCTCGIGTQALGLAMQGYAVTASDL